MRSILSTSVLHEAARLARDGELGNSAAIRILQMPHTDYEIAEILRRFAGQLTRDARAKLVRENFSPLPAGVDNQRFEPLFEKYPISGKTYTTKGGVSVLNEIHYYNGQMLHLYGECSQANRVREALDGSGYKPLLIRYPDGRVTASVQIWVNRLTDTSLRPYDSMFIVVPAVPEGLPDKPATLPGDDAGCATVLGMCRGSRDAGEGLYVNAARLYFVRLIDSTQVAIDVGRERMGTDKRPGRVRFDRDGGRLDVSVADRLGRRIVKAGLHLSDDPATHSRRLAQAASAIEGAAIDFAPGTEFVYPAVARIGDAPCVHWQWRTDLVPRHQPIAAGSVEPGMGSEEGALLARWGFEARWLGYIPNVRGVIVGLDDPPSANSAAASSEDGRTPSAETPPRVAGTTRLLVPIPSARPRSVARYWRRSVP